MFATIAYAQEAAAPQAGPLGMITSLLPMILLVAVFYFILIRPQQKRQKEHAAVLNALKSGDEIITSAGIYARIVSVEDPNTYIIELLPNGGKVKIVRSGIAGKSTPTTSSPVQEKK
ncbi:MAG: preprotein translocase subunit YajC [Deferribacteraceae bacterium]|jgi:preprotein translocase subunit YajC|nr:preprotein translocase subunit YajC [Deferribacteraceae bacterium]